MCFLFYSSFVCISAYAKVYFKTSIVKQNIKTILIAGVPSSQALPGFLITAPPSVCVLTVLVSLAGWIQNQKKSKNIQVVLKASAHLASGAISLWFRPDLRLGFAGPLQNDNWQGGVHARVWLYEAPWHKLKDGIIDPKPITSVSNVLVELFIRDRSLRLTETQNRLVLTSDYGRARLEYGVAWPPF